VSTPRCFFDDTHAHFPNGHAIPPAKFIALEGTVAFSSTAYTHGTLAAAIGGEGPRAGEERHVVVVFGIVDAKPRVVAAVVYLRD
jgi:hypothetical protein